MPGSKLGRREAIQTPGKPEVPASSSFDLNARPDRQNTYAFTTEELERLEDVKIAISRRYDLGVTKNDLVRCALHILLDDFEQNREGSAVLRRLRARTNR